VNANRNIENRERQTLQRPKDLSVFGQEEKKKIETGENVKSVPVYANATISQHYIRY
jgi:hypothetical protein